MCLMAHPSQLVKSPAPLGTLGVVESHGVFVCLFGRVPVAALQTRCFPRSTPPAPTVGRSGLGDSLSSRPTPVALVVRLLHLSRPPVPSSPRCVLVCISVPVFVEAIQHDVVVEAVHHEELYFCGCMAGHHLVCVRVRLGSVGRLQIRHRLEAAADLEKQLTLLAASPPSVAAHPDAVRLFPTSPDLITFPMASLTSWRPLSRSEVRGTRLIRHPQPLHGVFVYCWLRSLCARCMLCNGPMACVFASFFVNTCPVFRGVCCNRRGAA